MSDPQQVKLEKLEKVVENLEEIQYTQGELIAKRRLRIDNALENMAHKLHTLSNMYMGMEERLNELGEFASQVNDFATHLKEEIDDLRQSVESIGVGSDINS
jgi:uncharacterized coiled-coil DUF342 family protein